MRPKASHLYKSRHGIGYFRWLIPQDIRQRHPELPKELKRSTKTADSLAAFAWLQSLHPTAAGRVYAAFGGVYIGVAVVWLWLVDEVTPSTSDWIGVGICFLGMAIIMFGPRSGA